MKSPQSIFLLATLSMLCMLGSVKPSETAQKGKAHPSASKPPASSSTSAQMQRLIKTFAGKWSIHEEDLPSPMAPKGGTSEGREVWKAGPGGLSLVEDYSSNGAAGEFRGMSVTWDEAGKGYRSIWCDNTQSDGCIVMSKPGQWEGDRLVLGDEREIGGKMVVFRETVSEITPTSFKQMVEVQESGGPFKTTVVIHAKKLSG